MYILCAGAACITVSLTTCRCLRRQLSSESAADSKPAVQLPGVLERALNYKIERAKEVGVELSELERIGETRRAAGGPRVMG